MLSLTVALTLAALNTTGKIPLAMPRSFEASIYVTRSGMPYHGYVQVDGMGRRYSEYLNESRQTTIMLQLQGTSTVHRYVASAPNCNCVTEHDALLDDYWFIYMNARRYNEESCKGDQSGKEGLLFTLASDGYISQTEIRLCQASDGTPIYTAHNGEVMEFITFEAQPILDFNMTQLSALLPGCDQGCS